MNKTYNDALQEQGSHGKPIFLINVTLSKSQTFGASKRVKKEFFQIKKIVAAGTIEQVKQDPRVKLSCLVQLLGKQQAFKAERSKYTIEDFEVLSFHGYSIIK